MSTRKAFLAAAASTALLAAAPADTPPTGSPVPSPSPKAPKISQTARAMAETMRKFDPQLSDKDLETIAQGIDGNLGLGASIDPKGRALENWNEPATTTFEATS